MAELISAKDLPITEAEEVDVLCVDNGELKRKQAKGLGGAGGYVIRVPLSDASVGDNGDLVINLTESYDNFAQILYDGGSVALDISAIASTMLELPAGSVAYVPVSFWAYAPGMGISGQAAVAGITGVVVAANGTWTPPTE